MLTQIAEIFSNREKATYFWLGILFIWMLSQPKLRISLCNLVRAALHWKILSCFLILGFYAYALVNILILYNFLAASFIKDAITWFIFVAIPLLFKFMNTKERNSLFKEITSDLFKLSLLTEFVVSTYTFSFFGELAFIPVVAFVLTIHAFASTQEQYKQVERIFETLILIGGAVIIAFSTVQAVKDFQNLASLKTLVSILLPFILSILTAPIILVIASYSTYEMIAIRLKLGRKKQRSFILISTLKFFMHFGFRLKELRDFLEDHGSYLPKLTSTQEIDSLLNENRIS